MTAIQAALGKIPVDLLITNVHVANVLTGEIYPANIAIYGEQIVAVEAPTTLPARQTKSVLDGQGKLAIPGLIDSHLHIESSLVTPAPFAEAVLRHGVTTVAEDPHEIANSTGIDGVRRFLAASQNLPMTILFLASTCVPSAKGLETCQGELGSAEITEILTWDGVIGLAEVMDSRAVIDEDPRMSAIVQAGLDADAIIEGHNPMLRGRELQAYITAGVDSDHTLATPEDYVEKLRLGVTLQLQERYMSAAVMQAINALPQSVPTLCLVTDDIAPDYLEDKGHLDQVVRRAVSYGLAPMRALQAVTINAAMRLRLYDRGAIAPGKRADIALIDSIETFNVSHTISAGQVVVREGQTMWKPPIHQPELDALRDSLELTNVTPDHFAITPTQHGLNGNETTQRVRVIVSHPHGTTTEEGERTVKFVDGEPQLDETDLCLISVRARGEVGHSLGFLANLGLQRGAIATTHAHDSHNMAVFGRNRHSMSTAANAVIAMQGGIVVADGDEVLASVPLPIAGIISDSPISVVAAQMRKLSDVLSQLGVVHPYLLMRLTTYTLPVSTGLRITDMGYVRASERKIVPLFMEDAETL